MQKTAVVSVDRSRTHPVYKKLVTKTKKCKARDDVGVELGDVVVIEEMMPVSKTVSWKIVEKVDGESKK